MRTLSAIQVSEDRNTLQAAASKTDNLRQALRSRLREARARTDELFRIVRQDAVYDRPIPERHRIIFYLGHFEAFDWNLIARQCMGFAPVEGELDRLFAFGIDPVNGNLPDDAPSDWPSQDRVLRYVERSRSAIDQILDNLDFENPNSPHLKRGLAFHVAIEHRLMHAETLAYMIHWLPYNKKNARPCSVRSFTSPEQDSVFIPDGFATLGMTLSDAQPFGWDNEIGEHRVAVPAFRMERFKVTNAHFMRFVNEGGYATPSLWTPENWEWKELSGLEHPLSWMRRGQRWALRTMFAEIPLPPDWPVYVSHAEASAYAQWLGKSLPTEAQFHRAAFGTPSGVELDYPWGSESPTPVHGNFDFADWNSSPVKAFPKGRSAFGLYGLVGNGWEWTSTVFEPFDGFTPFPLYPGYSADFFDGQHFVLKGGSPRTAGCFLRRSFRNWFQARYPYIYSGFRCVENR